LVVRAAGFEPATMPYEGTALSIELRPSTELVRRFQRLTERPFRKVGAFSLSGPRIRSTEYP
jgi:hypothetical protein